MERGADKSVGRVQPHREAPVEDVARELRDEALLLARELESADEQVRAAFDMERVPLVQPERTVPHDAEDDDELGRGEHEAPLPRTVPFAHLSRRDAARPHHASGEQHDRFFLGAWKKEIGEYAERVARALPALRAALQAGGTAHNVQEREIVIGAAEALARYATDVFSRGGTLSYEDMDAVTRLTHILAAWTGWPVGVREEGNNAVADAYRAIRLLDGQLNSINRELDVGEVPDGDAVERELLRLETLANDIENAYRAYEDSLFELYAKRAYERLEEGGDEARSAALRQEYDAIRNEASNLFASAARYVEKRADELAAAVSSNALEWLSKKADTLRDRSKDLIRESGYAAAHRRVRGGDSPADAYGIGLQEAMRQLPDAAVAACDALEQLSRVFASFPGATAESDNTRALRERIDALKRSLR